MDNNLKKSLYQAFKKALGSQKDLANSAQKVVNDVLDPNLIAEAPQDAIPAQSKNVLHKDISPSEIHQQKQMQAQAKLGMPVKPLATPAAPANGDGPKKPSMPKMPTVPKIQKNVMPSMMTNEEEGMETPEKGVHKLKKFMEKSSMKKSQKGVHKPYIENRSKAGVYSARYSQNPTRDWAHKEYAKEEHKKVLNDLKSMPKPKLPK